MLLPLLVAGVSARFFAPPAQPYAQPSPQVQPRPALRASTPTMIVTPDFASAPVVLPETVTVAVLSDYDPGPLTDAQVFTALIFALVAGILTARLARALYD